MSSPVFCRSNLPVEIPLLYQDRSSSRAGACSREFLNPLLGSKLPIWISGFEAVAENLLTRRRDNLYEYPFKENAVVKSTGGQIRFQGFYFFSFRNGSALLRFSV
ncbi:MAG: hypothetical protein CVU64_06925 [Deltaproteobacteria bacterium HGW-Deltaproteobacteria-21]|nr:MAG: hypothetical protein CVU64_06925 [Deltaproteobacteria bacterium HGW-Deltaproteobacteria-21]